MSDRPDVDAALDRLSDAELLSALNSTLAKRQRPPTEEELVAQQERDADLEYQRFYPTRGSR